MPISYQIPDLDHKNNYIITSSHPFGYFNYARFHSSSLETSSCILRLNRLSRFRFTRLQGFRSRLGLSL